MNKKITSEIAVGIVLLLTIMLVAMFYFQNKKISLSSSLLSAQAPSTNKADSGDNNVPQGQINTKYGYEKSLELLKGEVGLNLTYIGFTRDISDPEFAQYNNKIIYGFYSNTKAINTIYDFTTDMFQLVKVKL